MPMHEVAPSAVSIADIPPSSLVIPSIPSSLVIPSVVEYSALPLRLPLVLQSGTKRVKLLIFLKAGEQPKPIELNYEACYISNENL